MLCSCLVYIARKNSDQKLAATLTRAAVKSSSEENIRGLGVFHQKMCYFLAVSAAHGWACERETGQVRVATSKVYFLCGRAPTHIGIWPGKDGTGC